MYTAKSGNEARVELVPGGSGGNVAYRLDELGVRVGLAAAISQDPAGVMLETLIKREHPHLEFIPLGRRYQRLSIIVNLIGQTGARAIHYQITHPIRSLSEVMGLMKNFSSIHMTGYLLEVVRPAALAEVIMKATAERLGTSLDLFPRVQRASRNGSTMKLLNMFDTVFGNQNEFGRLTGSTRVQDVEANFPGVRELVIKRGSRGATVITSEGTFTHAAPEVEPVSLKGAGDALVAEYLFSRKRGNDVKTSLARAVEFATSHVTSQRARHSKTRSGLLLSVRRPGA